jgi:hypothetical protein
MTAPDSGDITVRDIMLEFAARTGLSPAGPSPDRYLWTDAFAVCNFLGLYRQTGDEQYRRLALLLVEQVHAVLGRHRADDPRKGWISGLDEEEGQRHPTMGGLRIGKKSGERRPEEPFDEESEWDRDGQYFHYLTQWMHALECVSLVTGDPTFTRWAVELAKTAHAAFAYSPRRGEEKRLYWKMSIDLSRPLVPSMGHHDPLDGFVTYSELHTAVSKLSGQTPQPELRGEIADMTSVCKGRDWATDDPLGIGGLLISAWRMGRLILAGGVPNDNLFEAVINDSARSLDYFDRSSLNLPADYRLAFRELGLSIGLQAATKLNGLAGRYPELIQGTHGRSRIQGLMRHTGLIETINAFWLAGRNRRAATWTGHRMINIVMLATSLSPDGYLSPE